MELGQDSIFTFKIKRVEKQEIRGNINNRYLTIYKRDIYKDGIVSHPLINNDTVEDQKESHV
jgi:hypothetical protein